MGSRMIRRLPDEDAILPHALSGSVSKGDSCPSLSHFWQGCCL
jgi:hypothetical protein